MTGFTIPEIQAAYEELRASAREGNLQRAEEGGRAFHRVATTCHDLLAQELFDRAYAYIAANY
jgi:hypothetical protein